MPSGAINIHPSMVNTRFCGSGSRGSAGTSSSNQRAKAGCFASRCVANSDAKLIMVTLEPVLFENCPFEARLLSRKPAALAQRPLSGHLLDISSLEGGHYDAPSHFGFILDLESKSAQFWASAPSLTRRRRDGRFVPSGQESPCDMAPDRPPPLPPPRARRLAAHRTWPAPS